MVVLDKNISDLNHEQDILLREYVEAMAIRVFDAKRLHTWSDLAQILKMREHTLVFLSHPTNCSLVNYRRSRVDCEEILEQHVIQNIRHGHTNSAYAIAFFFQRSNVNRKTLHRVYYL